MCWCLSRFDLGDVVGGQGFHIITVMTQKIFNNSDMCSLKAVVGQTSDDVRKDVVARNENSTCETTPGRPKKREQSETKT